MGLGSYHVAVLLSGALLVYLSMSKSQLFVEDYWALLTHLGAVGTWLGTTIWVTFFAGLLLFKNLPRAQFGEVQSAIFPWYFGFCFMLSSLSLATWLHLLGGPSAALTTAPVMVLAGASFLLALQLTIIGPIVTKAMRERRRAEKEAESGDQWAVASFAKAKKHFGALHGVSSLANLLIVLAALYHTWVLSTQFVLRPPSSTSP